MVISSVILFTIFNFVSLPGIWGAITVISPYGNSNASYTDYPASFGLSLSDLNIQGAILPTSKENITLGCSASQIDPAPIQPPFNDATLNWFLVVARGSCTFGEKAMWAQAAGYGAVLVHNYLHQREPVSVICVDNSTSGLYCSNITIYVTIVSNADGIELVTDFNVDSNYTIAISGSPSESYLYYLLPFVIVVGIVIVVILGFFLYRFIRDYRISRRNRLSRWNLRKIPTRKFRKGIDTYECCSICLDDFEDGDRLRILPCDHAYHIKCIDPWLLNNRRNCPICKRRVRIPGETDPPGDADGGSADHQPVAGLDAGVANPVTGGLDIQASTSAAIEHVSAYAIGEGRARLGLGYREDAPLLRQASESAGSTPQGIGLQPSGNTNAGLMCCIPRSYHSVDSIVDVSTAIATPEASRQPEQNTLDVDAAARVIVDNSIVAASTAQVTVIVTDATQRNARSGSEVAAETEASSLSVSSMSSSSLSNDCSSINFELQPPPVHQEQQSSNNTVVAAAEVIVSSPNNQQEAFTSGPHTVAATSADDSSVVRIV